MALDRSAPPVVAVVVTCEPGPWLGETLRALAGQDYPNLSVLVVYAGADEPPDAWEALARLVGELAPEAYLRRAGSEGFAAGVNEVIGLVEGASHYLICHDDVVAEPGALRLLVEEAFRSNAGVVAPKLVDWDRPDLLQSIGASIDRVGTLEPRVERGELDQGQHDTPADVFVAPGGALLVRADLFDALGGYDRTFPAGGEDLELSWRCLLAGARVRVAPAARARHLEAHSCGLGSEASDRLAADRSRWPILLSCASAPTLCWLLPSALLQSTGEALAVAARGGWREASSIVVAACAPWSHPVRMWRSRRRAQRHRAVRDRSLRPLQVGGSGRVRSRLASAKRLTPFDATSEATVADPVAPAEGAIPPATAASAAAVAGDGARGQGQGGTGVVAVALGVVLVFLLFGSRGVLFGHLPGVGSIPVGLGGPLWHQWLSSWQPDGLGTSGSGPPALALLGIGRLLTLGSTGLLRHLVVLGPLVLGPLGAYRLARRWGSTLAPVVALVAYACCPLPYDDFAWGRWGALTAYAAAPWTVAALVRLSGSLPQRPQGGRRRAGRVVALGILVALGAAVAPSWLVVVPVVAGALALGSLLVGQAGAAGRVAVGAAAGVVVAFVLLLPWSAEVVGHAPSLFGPGPGATPAASFARLLRFGLGPVATGPLGWGLLVAAGLPLVIGRSWRFEWALRLWLVALTCFGWAYLSGSGAFPSPPVEVLLAPAAAALAGSVAVGVVAFEQDLPGYRFGWRQAVSAIAAAGLLLAVLPSVADAVGGRWQLPTAGPSSALASLDAVEGGDYRVLWVGDPRAIPMASVPTGGGEAWAMSFDGLPTVATTWTSGPLGGASTVSADLALATDGLTGQLGHLLGPLGVRYLVVPRFDAPSGSGAEPVPVPRALVDGLDRQTDLEQVGSDPHYLVYSNAAWVPVRAEVPGGVGLPARVSPGELVAADLVATRAALSGGPVGARGEVSSGERIYVSATFSPGWRLLVDHHTLRPSRALDVGMSWTVPPGVSGPAVLQPGGAPLRRGLQWLVVVLWALAVAATWAARRGDAEAPAPEDGTWPGKPEPALAAGGSEIGRRALQASPVPVVGDDEELWADG